MNLHLVVPWVFVGGGSCAGRLGEAFLREGAESRRFDAGCRVMGWRFPQVMFKFRLDPVKACRCLSHVDVLEVW